MSIDYEDLTEDLRLFLQDDPELNVLLNGREFKPSLVKLAIRMMISDFNRVNFITRFTVGDFPEGTLSVQIYGTVQHLLNSASLLQIRNHLPYNDAGLSIAEFSKSGEYSAMADKFKGLFEEGALDVKYDLNIFQGMGGVMSEYSYYGGWSTIYSHTLH